MDIVRIWKDPEYRDSLSAEDLADAPRNPAGLSRMAGSEPELMLAAASGAPMHTFGCCQPHHTMTTTTTLGTVTTYCIISVQIC